MSDPNLELLFELETERHHKKINKIIKQNLKKLVPLSFECTVLRYNKGLWELEFKLFGAWKPYFKHATEYLSQFIVEYCTMKFEVLPEQVKVQAEYPQIRILLFEISTYKIMRIDEYIYDQINLIIPLKSTKEK